MVRTRNTACRIGSKAPRKAIDTPALDLKGKKLADLFTTKKTGGGGGNRYCPRETPSWQKEITHFFPRLSEGGDCSSTQSSSSQPDDTNPSSSQPDNTNPSSSQPDNSNPSSLSQPDDDNPSSPSQPQESNPSSSQPHDTSPVSATRDSETECESDDSS